MTKPLETSHSTQLSFQTIPSFQPLLTAEHLKSRQEDETPSRKFSKRTSHVAQRGSVQAHTPDSTRSQDVNAALLGARAKASALPENAKKQVPSGVHSGPIPLKPITNTALEQAYSSCNLRKILDAEQQVYAQNQFRYLDQFREHFGRRAGSVGAESVVFRSIWGRF